MLDAEGDALAGAIELQDLDGHLVAGMQNFRWMADTPVGHVGHVQQTINAAQVDEGAVFGEILDDAGDHSAFFQMFQGDGFAFDGFLLHGQLARNHHVAAAPVQLDELDGDVLADEGFEIADRAAIDLRSGHEAW